MPTDEAIRVATNVLKYLDRITADVSERVRTKYRLTLLASATCVLSEEEHAYRARIRASMLVYPKQTPMQVAITNDDDSTYRWSFGVDKTVFGTIVNESESTKPAAGRGGPALCDARLLVGMKLHQLVTLKPPKSLSIVSGLRHQRCRRIRPEVRQTSYIRWHSIRDASIAWPSLDETEECGQLILMSASREPPVPIKLLGRQQHKRRSAASGQARHRQRQGRLSCLQLRLHRCYPRQRFRWRHRHLVLHDEALREAILLIRDKPANLHGFVTSRDERPAQTQEQHLRCGYRTWTRRHSGQQIWSLEARRESRRAYMTCAGELTAGRAALGSGLGNKPLDRFEVGVAFKSMLRTSCRRLWRLHRFGLVDRVCDPPCHGRPFDFQPLQQAPARPRDVQPSVPVAYQVKVRLRQALGAPAR